jgi:hypothetical protein
MKAKPTKPTQPIIGAMYALYSNCGSGILGRAVVESLLAYEHHGELTVRLGVNRDKTMTVFSTNRELAELMQRMLARGGSVRINKIPTFSPRKFNRLLSREDFRKNILGAAQVEAPDEPETPADIYPSDTGDWVEPSAKAYIERMAADMDEADGAKLRDATNLVSEARLRILLNESFGWKADKLNEVVEELTGPITDLVRLYGLCQGTVLGRMLIETVATVQVHEGTSVRLSANQDGSLSVFCSDEILGKLVAEAITQKGDVHLGVVEEMDVDTFAAGVWDRAVSGVLNRRAVGGPDEQDERPWPELAARAFIQGQIDRLQLQAYEEDREDAEDRPSPTRRETYPIDNLSAKKRAVLVSALKEPDAVTSEMRFRTLLQEILHWGKEKLDAAVLSVWGTEDTRGAQDVEADAN